MASLSGQTLAETAPERRLINRSISKNRFDQLLNPIITLLENTTPIDEEFNLFLFAILVLGIIFICICVLLALIISILCLLVIFGLITAGTLSASVIVGINKQSFTSGFTTFVTLFSTLTFGVVGIGSFWALNKITHWWSEIKAMTIGLSIGVVSGFVTGVLIAFVIKKLSIFLKNKLDRRRGIS